MRRLELKILVRSSNKLSVIFSTSVRKFYDSKLGTELDFEANYLVSSLQSTIGRRILRQIIKLGLYFNAIE